MKDFYIHLLDWTRAVENLEHEKMKEKIRLLRKYLLDERSEKMHRMTFAFLNYLFEQQSDFEKFEDFYFDIKQEMGFGSKKYQPIYKQDGKGKRWEPLTGAGHQVALLDFRPYSLSFGQCKQKRFADFFDKLKVYAMEKYSIDFEEWKKHEKL